MKLQRGMRGVGMGLVVVAAAVFLVAEEGRPDRPELPAAAAAAIQRLFPGAVVRDVDRDSRDGVALYEVKVRDADGQRGAEIEVLTDGLVVRVEEDWPADALPEAVGRGLRRSLSKAQIREVRKRTRTEVSYELEVVQNGRRREVRITHSGRVLEIEKRD